MKTQCGGDLNINNFTVWATIGRPQKTVGASIARPKTHKGGNNLKKIIKSRKGAAMELAIGVMFLMMAFTIMLLSTSGLQNSLRVNDYEDFNEMVEVNNIGEYVAANSESYANKENSKIIIDGEDTGYTVTSDLNNTYIITKGEETVLTITVIDGEITSWN